LEDKTVNTSSTLDILVKQLRNKAATPLLDR